MLNLMEKYSRIRLAATARLSAVVLLLAGDAGGQQAPARPAFEAASIKPSDRNSGLPPQIMAIVGQGVGASKTVPMKDPVTVSLRNTSLEALIAMAYGVRPDQVHGPAWMADDLFDLNARVVDGTPHEQVGEMLQTLLGERFGLELHRERKEASGYALLAPKAGTKLKPGEPPPEVQPTGDEVKSRLMARLEEMRNQPRPEGSFSSYHFPRMTMESLADRLSSFLGSPVVDMTGLDGTYAIDLEFEGDPKQDQSVVFEAAAKLGLKLERRTALSIENLVIDKVNKTPTPD
jgi:uncharacterized protein (TIGR03435 family)